MTIVIIIRELLTDRFFKTNIIPIPNTSKIEQHKNKQSKKCVV